MARPVRTGDSATTRGLDDADAAQRRAAPKQGTISAGLLREGVDIAAAPTPVQHRLGRPPTGWVVVDADVAATVFRTAAADNNFISLQASSAGTFSILFF